MELSAIIRQEICDNGPISFRDFMELALYHPKLGYYMAGHNCIGSKGDFYTSSSLGPVFGAMVARQLEEMWRYLGTTEFTVVEYGAGTGALCHDILDYFSNYTAVYDRLHYVIIEKSPAMCEREKSHLPKSVRWCNSLGDVGQFTGCVLSNELLDNFAVHQVLMQEELMEVFVGDELTEILQPANETLNNYFFDLDVRLPAGFRSEVNLDALDWLGDISRHLQRGYVMTIDYGYETEELYKACHSGGTLLCYHSHQVNECYYDHIGMQDITAYVNFSALCHWGRLFGLSCCGLVSQAHFLLALNFKQFLRRQRTTGNILQLALEEVQLTRKLLVDMGNKFKVLIQSKNMPPYSLAGLGTQLNSPY